MLPQVCVRIRLLPMCLLCGKKSRPLQSPWVGGEGSKEPSPQLPPPSGPGGGRGGGRARVPRALASPRGAASPTIPLARHFSIRAHRPGSGTPAFESSWGGGLTLPPSLGFCPLWRASGGAAGADRAGECGSNPRWKPLRMELVSICSSLGPRDPPIASQKAHCEVL